LADAVGELTNIVAGNVKPHLSSGVGLGTPETTFRRAFDNVDEGYHRTEVEFEDGELRFVVTLLKNTVGSPSTAHLISSSSSLEPVCDL
jgi:hypothetical protein